MARGLQRAVDNFVTGMRMGWAHQDRLTDQQAKADAAKFAAAKWAQQADLKRQELGIAGKKADAYAGLAGAQAGYYARKGAGGTGGGATADVNGATLGWLDAHGGSSLSTDNPQQGRTVVNVDSPPPALPDPGGTPSGRHRRQEGRQSPAAGARRASQLRHRVCPRRYLRPTVPEQARPGDADDPVAVAGCHGCADAARASPDGGVMPAA